MLIFSSASESYVNNFPTFGNRKNVAILRQPVNYVTLQSTEPFAAVHAPKSSGGFHNSAEICINRGYGLKNGWNRSPRKKPCWPSSSMRMSADGMDNQEGLRVFFSNLPEAAKEEKLQELVKPFSGVKEVKLIKPGMGYVVIESPEAADIVIDKLNGVKVNGKAISVRHARSYFIQKQNDARMQVVQNQRQRMESSKALEEERARRMREQRIANNSPEAQRRKRAEILEEMRAEGWYADQNPYVSRAPSGQVKRVPQSIGRRKPTQVSVDPTELSEEWNEALEEERRIRNQAVLDVMKQEDKKRNPSRVSDNRRKKSEEQDLSTEDMAKLVHDRMKQIKKTEKSSFVQDYDDDEEDEENTVDRYDNRRGRGSYEAPSARERYSIRGDAWDGEDENDEEEDDIWSEFDEVNREYEEEEEDHDVDNPVWKERARERWNEWKEEQGDAIEALFDDDFNQGDSLIPSKAKPGFRSPRPVGTKQSSPLPPPQPTEATPLTPEIASILNMDVRACWFLSCSKNVCPSRRTMSSMLSSPRGEHELRLGRERHR